MKAIGQYLDYRLPAHMPLYRFWLRFVKIKILHGFVTFRQRKLMFLRRVLFVIHPSKNPNQACTIYISQTSDEASRCVTSSGQVYRMTQRAYTVHKC